MSEATTVAAGGSEAGTVRPARIAVFASGGGTNLQALLDSFAARPEGGEIALVVSDRAGVGALDRAAQAGVAGRVIPVRDRAPDDVAKETLEALEAATIDVIALAGYLRLVPGRVVEHYSDRIVNIHPALLPAFGGKGMYGRRIHEAVLEAACRVTGVTVHYVDEVYDRGGILMQWPVPVLPTDTPAELAGRVLRVEHAVYPPVVEALARATARGEAFRPPDVHGTMTFGLLRREAPPEAEIRGLLGL